MGTIMSLQNLSRIESATESNKTSAKIRCECVSNKINFVEVIGPDKQIIKGKMLIGQLVKSSNNSIVQLMALYSILMSMRADARCNDQEGVCWKNGAMTKRTIYCVTNPCFWSVTINCMIECVSGCVYDNASNYIQRLYDATDKSECRLKGISLKLHSVANNKLEGNWFGANITLNELDLDVENIYQIKGNPFVVHQVFSNVAKLTLRNLCPCALKKDMFKGLNSLESLTLSKIRFDNISDIESGMLEFVKETIQRFELIEKDANNNAISIDCFTGDNSAVLLHLEYVKVRYNLSSINNLSFTAIPNVKELDLSDCQITDIGERAFRNLGENFQLLKLERNLLVTLPIETFKNLNLNPVPDEPFLKIRLGENPWRCDCDMEHFMQFMSNYSNFVGEICEEEICPDPTTTTTSTTTTTTQSTSTTSYDSSSEFIEKQCSSSAVEKENVSVTFPNHRIHVNIELNEVSLVVNSTEPNLAVIWIGAVYTDNNFTWSHRESSNIKCEVISHQREIKLNSFDRETAYTICVIYTDSTTVSPLDCISHYRYGAVDNPAWLLESSKTLVISLIVGGCLIVIIVSAIVGFRFRMELLCFNKTISCTQGTVDANFSNESMNNVTEECQKSNKESDQEPGQEPGQERLSLGNISMLRAQPLPPLPPPLPVKSKWQGVEEIEDNYYATIKYTRTK